MSWPREPGAYLRRIQEALYPGNLYGQGRVAWAVYWENVDLTGDARRDMAAIRLFLANQDVLDRRRTAAGCTCAERADIVAKKQIHRLSDAPPK